MNILSRLILIVLAAIAVALYIRVILPPEEPAETRAAATAPAAETRTAAPAAADTAQEARAADTGHEAQAAAEAGAQMLQPLPADQMKLVLQTLAPELMRENAGSSPAPSAGQ